MIPFIRSIRTVKLRETESIMVDTRDSGGGGDEELLIMDIKLQLHKMNKICCNNIMPVINNTVLCT